MRRYGSAIAWVTSILVSVFLYSQITAEQHDRDRDNAQRRDQNCLLFEGAHKADVDELKKTYRYLRALPREEAKSGLNQFVVANLPALERKARHDGAPDYCDKPHVGRPEPDPVLPKRQDFRYLLKR